MGRSGGFRSRCCARPLGRGRRLEISPAREQQRDPKKESIIDKAKKKFDDFLHFGRTSPSAVKSISHIAEKLGVGNKLFDPLLSVVNLGHVPRRDVRSMKRFLFLQYQTALGSALNATPVFEALRRAIPDATIAVAACGFPYAVCKSNRYLDDVYETPNPQAEFFQTLLYFLRHMPKWRREFDCVITDSFTMKGRFALLQVATGIPVRAGFTQKPTWLHHPLVHANEHSVRIQTSVIENNMRILDVLGLPSQPLEPGMFITESELRAGEALLQEFAMEGEPLVVIVPQGSGGQPHIWFEDRFAQVADRLYDDHRARLVFAGAAGNSAYVEEIRRRMRAPSLNLAGKTSIPELAGVLCRADLMLSIDTGVMHLGRALQVPTVILTSASQSTREWLPAGMDEYVVLRRDHVPCALCWKSFCATRECMDEISADDVVLAIENQLRRFPPSAEARRERQQRAVVDLSPRQSVRLADQSGPTRR